MYKHNMAIMKILAVLLGVAIGVVFTSQSETEVMNEEPMESRDVDEEKRRIETPEVVLQLKYDRGELNRIYLAQFRKGKNIWSPSVSARNSLCADLCHAGLGGEACGPTCSKLMPIGLQAALTNSSDYGVSYGQPRVDVCPTLCSNMLGEPLCGCGKGEKKDSVEWNEICEAFCSDNYVLAGCPACEPADPETTRSSAFRTLSTVEGWAAWCSVQCRQGQGGAACNCDRAPL